MLGSSKERLEGLAIEALLAIGETHNKILWTEGQEGNPIKTFIDLVNESDIQWVIDSAVGTGMSHLGLSYFILEANKYM